MDGIDKTAAFNFKRCTLFSFRTLNVNYFENVIIIIGRAALSCRGPCLPKSLAPASAADDFKRLLFVGLTDYNPRLHDVNVLRYIFG